MSLGLGIGISRQGGPLNPDGLSLDLAFALDKTLTARKGPTPTFTRASTATFVGSNGLIQSAAINEARFDHDPVTLDCKGLLIEESRGNLSLRSEEFNNAYWTKAGTTVAAPVVTADQVNSPSGVQLADRIVFPAVVGANAFSIVFREFTQAAGVSTTQSIYLQGSVGGEKIFIMWTPNGVTYARKECILTTSWQRFDLTYTSVNGLNYFQFGVDLRDASQSTQSAQTIFAWGAQVEAGSFATSYIPTTTAALTRSADVCSISGGNFTSFYNQGEGTILTSAMVANLVSVNRGVLQIDNGAAAHQFRQVYGLFDGGFRNLVSDNDTLTVLGSNAGSVSTLQKMAISFVGTSFAGTINGAAVTTATRTVPIGVNILRVGSILAGSLCLNGHIARIQYFRKRLPNAKLITLTTP